MIENMIERSDLIKPGLFAVIAGPCAIESAEQIYNIAIKLSTMGIGYMTSTDLTFITNEGQQNLKLRFQDLIKDTP